MKEYTVIQDQASGVFIAAVNTALQEGWCLHGSVHTQVWTYDVDGIPTTEWWYMQAMTREGANAPFAS